MTDITGQTIGGYRIEGLIGAGREARVFRALPMAGGRPVALKLFAVGAEQGFAERLRAAIDPAIGLRHPRIVEIYEIGAADGQAFLAMELVAGSSLAALLVGRGDTLPLAQVVDLVQQAAEGLAYAHGKNTVHGDLRPANMLLARRFAGYDLKLGDFGLATLVEADGYAATGAVAGSPAYLAPEQLQGEAPTSATDVYALGVVLYELGVGKPPFASTTLSEAIAGHVRGVPSPPRAQRPEISTLR